MNAVERFFAASQTHHVDEAAEALALDVVMFNPASADLIMGKAAVTEALRAVESACDEFRHTHLLVDAEHRVYGLVFTARVGDAVLEGVDILEVDDTDHIKTFRVAARPATSLMALAARMRNGAG